MTWTTFGADVPRFPFPDNWLLIEGQRTNGIRNPRGEGSVPGAPGTVPTNWVFTTPALGLVREVLSPVIIDGITYQRIRYSGTATGGAVICLFDAATAFAATQGQLVTSSLWLGLVVNSGTTPALRLSNREFEANGTTVPDADSAGPLAAPTATPTRITRSRAVVAATTAFVANGLRIETVAATAYDFILFLGWPQIELGGFASSNILPPAGTPGASTRGRDILTAPLSSLGVGPTSWTFLFTAVPPSNGEFAHYLSVSDGSLGTSANRIVLLGPISSGTELRAAVTTGGVSQFDNLIATTTPGTPIRVGVTYNGATVRISVDGGAVFTITPATPPTALTQVDIGNRPDGLRPLWSTMGRVIARGRSVTDAELQALTAALPIP